MWATVIAGIRGKRKLKRLGIVGGLGPETSCKFCLNINTKFRNITNCQPDIALENVPIPSDLEKSVINGENSPEMFKILKKAVLRLNNNQVDLIVIPCNTVHVFINELRQASRIPILSIIEECAKECFSNNFKKVGVLATTKSINEKLHSNELEKRNISTVIPNQNTQKEISKIIIRIIHNQIKKEDKNFLLTAIKEMKQKGAESVILGCTDLFILLNEEDSTIPMIDTTKVLENSTIKLLI